jgi:hypothetical protein
VAEVNHESAKSKAASLMHHPDAPSWARELAAAYIELVERQATHPPTPEAGTVTEEDLSFITGDLLIDADACAMGTATEKHHDVMARDLRKRIAAALAGRRGA